MFTVACAYTLPLLQGRPVAAIKVGSWDPGCQDVHLRKMWNIIIITIVGMIVITIIIMIITVTIIIKPPGWHLVHLLRLWGLGKCGLETPISCIIREEGGAHAIRVTGFNLLLSPMRNTRAL